MSGRVLQPLTGPLVARTLALSHLFQVEHPIRTRMHSSHPDEMSGTPHYSHNAIDYRNALAISPAGRLREGKKATPVVTGMTFYSHMIA